MTFRAICCLADMRPHQAGGARDDTRAHVSSASPSCLSLCSPMECSPPGSSVRDSPGRNPGVGCRALLQGTLLTQGLTRVSYTSCIGRRVLYH